MDICHVNNQHYLTLIDCGPSRYAIWRGIRRQDTASVTEQLESVFLERGAPKELLTDNATSFRSSLFGEFANRWGIAIRYRCAHVPSGNGISERCHRTVKTILARKGCSVAEAVYRYNVMPRGNDAASAPANQIFRYEVRLLGIDEVRQQNQSADDQHRYSVGDRVWIRHPSRRCNSRSLEGTVTRLVSPQNVEVDGMPRHVRDLRLVTSPLPTPGELSASEQPDVVEEDDVLLIQVPGPARGSEDEGTIEEGADSPERPQLRRGSRERRPTQLCQYSDL
ncbi:Endogenous retrovirus group K member 19 Pol protein [Chionoecetes opilio]|uniref:Endogenous retrovirus group K member 19 Pol protein n=1 Tax=Chionoecetes opilio TaxID=41210 RepID=A0A8J4Y6Z8_CHIOP|nr:Endogenous retrovirus group K member 19 Pol protein [Chionoecetes opilio]